MLGDLLSGTSFSHIGRPSKSGVFSQILCIFLTNCARSQRMWVGTVFEKVAVRGGGWQVLCFQ